MKTAKDEKLGRVEIYTVPWEFTVSGSSDISFLSLEERLVKLSEVKP